MRHFSSIKNQGQLNVSCDYSQLGLNIAAGMSINAVLKAKARTCSFCRGKSSEQLWIYLRIENEQWLAILESTKMTKHLVAQMEKRKRL